MTEQSWLQHWRAEQMQDPDFAREYRRISERERFWQELPLTLAVLLTWACVVAVPAMLVILCKLGLGWWA